MCKGLNKFSIARTFNEKMRTKRRDLQIAGANRSSLGLRLVITSSCAGADASTAQFLQQMMPLCDHHAFVEMFVGRQSKHEYGAELRIESTEVFHLEYADCVVE